MSVDASPATLRNQVDLHSFIDWRGVECLNQNTGQSLPNALKQEQRDDETLFLESDADEQLLIYIPFTQVIKLHSVVVTGPEEEGPRAIHFFTNREHMGFSNVSDFPPSDSVVLTSDHLKGKPVTLKYVKFQSVRSLTIFIEDNQGGSDTTKVQKIALLGTTITPYLLMLDQMGLMNISKEFPILTSQRIWRENGDLDLAHKGRNHRHEGSEEDRRPLKQKIPSRSIL